MQVQAARLDIQLDFIAIAHKRKRSAERGFRRHMQHDGAVGRAAHARIRNTHHIAHTLFEQLLRDGQVADLGHARSADGSGILQHEHVRGRYFERVIVYARFEVVHIFEYERRSAMIQQRRGGGSVLDDRAIGREVAAQDAQATFGLQRISQRADDIGIADLGIGDILREPAPRDREGIAVQQGQQLL